MSRESQAGVYEQAGVAMTCRCYEEYESMFQLTPEMLGRGKVLDVAGGASSFAAEVNRLGYEAFAVDPLYQLDPAAMEQHGKREIETASQKLAGIADAYQWDFYGSLERHREQRVRSLELFVASYAAGRENGRYVIGQLPELPFADASFALILCSHFLFLYHQQFDFDFHLQAVRELLRVCQTGGEVRLYPLVGLNKQLYPHLEQLIMILQEEGVTAELVPTTFRFLPEATHLLRLQK